MNGADVTRNMLQNMVSKKKNQLSIIGLILFLFVIFLEYDCVLLCVCHLWPIVMHAGCISLFRDVYPVQLDYQFTTLIRTNNTTLTPQISLMLGEGTPIMVSAVFITCCRAFLSLPVCDGYGQNVFLWFTLLTSWQAQEFCFAKYS